MLPRPRIFDQLAAIAPIIPAPLFWVDINGVFWGGNDLNLPATGLKSLDPFVGKRFDEIHPREIALPILENMSFVVKYGKSIQREEVIKDFETGEFRYFTAIKSPLYEDGLLVGVVCTSVEITAQKNAEQKSRDLALEYQKLELQSINQKIATKLEEHQKFRHVADQMAHDLGSPLMALSVLENSCAELPEDKRNMLKESISRIRDIAGSLLNQYKPLEAEIDKVSSEELLVYAALEQIIMDKQYEYHNLPIKFKFEYTKDSISSFIKIGSTDFKRMLSNFINNSVEAIDKQSGNVLLKLDSDNSEVRISIVDNGKGIPESVIDKIMNNISITDGKVNGHGIGFRQIHETLSKNKGKLFIDSKPGISTTVTVSFPKIPAPDWIAEEITINSSDTVLILDDDNSIHKAWDIRFANIIKNAPTIKIRHFKYASEVIFYIEKLSDSERESIFLLSDYELLKQNLNGLDVISKTKIERSVLVTSHYSNINVREQAYNTNTKILPKILAPEININLLQ